MNFLKYLTYLTPLFYFSLLASPPVPFSGKLAVDGTNFHGNALFSFSIVDQEGTEHWRHAEEQDSTIEIFVLNGRYVALLGGQGMLPLPGDLFLKEKSLSLRASVDLQDGQGMRLLSPDQQITSTPYALAAELAQLAERATIADGVNTGSVTASMLQPELLEDLNRTFELGPISRDMLAEAVRNDLNATITRDRLSADVRADLNRTVRLQDLSTEVSQTINRSITLSDLDSEVISELNNTIALGSISLDQLSQDVRDDINRSIKSNDLDPLLKRYFAPTINTSPVSSSVIQGANISLTVSADGKFLTYQWKRNDQVLAGETSSTLSLNEANASNDDANYSVMVSNDWGSVSSENVRLTVATALPSVTLNGSANMTHEASTSYVDAGASAADALGNDLTSSLVVSGADVNVTELGEHTVSYSVTDVGGNTNSVSRTVTVEDTTAPVLSLIGDNNHSHGVNTAWADPGYSATDSLEGNLTANVAISGDIDVNTTGEYTLTYSVSDSSGNEANLTRIVNVQPLGPWTFTNAGATGRLGPTQAQIDANYSGTSLEGLVTINSTYQGIQEWTVPASGTYRIEAWGAKGGNGFQAQEDLGGNGAYLKGDFNLTFESNLTILIGQMGANSPENIGGKSAGGGGATYVLSSFNQSISSIILISGGGGGSGNHNINSGTAGGNASVSQDGSDGRGSMGGNGGSNGGAGISISGTGNSAGAGFLESSISHQAGWATEAKKIILGGIGASQPGRNTGALNLFGGDGGFGGGGAGAYGGGGGGGFSGGGAGHYSGGETGGGGGGSYNSGTNQDNQAGVNEGHGKVVITFVSP